MDRKINTIVIDIDGTMTDAGIYYDDHGNELKKFCTKDSAAFYLSKYLGIRTVIITGRECAATLRRLKELDAVEHLLRESGEWDDAVKVVYSSAGT